MIRAMQKIWVRGTGIVKTIAVSLVLLSAVFQINSAAAQTVRSSSSERITAFNSDIRILENGNIEVTEAISVDAHGVSIKRGIYRDIPLVVLNAAKFYDVGGITINHVMLDGRTVSYKVEKLSGAIRIYMGSSRQHLTAGDHTFTLTYTMNDQLAFGSDIDELYWNVTGNDWQFAIENVTAVVHLPDGATVSDLSVYTGPKGSTGGRYSILSGTGELAKARTVTSLPPGHGMTLAVSWPAGYVARPTFIGSAAKLVVDNKGIFAGLALCLILLAYYTLAWRKFGKDPDGPTVIPRFEPPAGMSPAEVGFMWRNANGGQNFATKAFAVVLTSLAVKKRLTIKVTNKDEYILTRIPGHPEDLPDDEQTVLNSLLRQSSNTEITIGREYRKEVQSARSSLITRYSADKRSTYFVRKERQWQIGCVIGVLAVAATIMLDPLFGAYDVESTIGAAVISALFVVAVNLVLNGLRRFWISAVGKGDGGLGNYFKFAMVGGAFVGPALAFGIILVGAISPIALCVGIAAVAICCLFHVLLEVPTAEFLRLRSEIEGYRRYLTVAEEDQLNFKSREMGDAIELFEKHLPFAMALDAEDVWTGRLEAFLSAMPVKQGEDANQYNPSWYQDGRRGWHGIGAFGIRSVRQLSAAAVSYGAPSAPSAGIASGGGGFSGGGRGGGGGGGW